MLLHVVLGDGIPGLILSFPFMPHDTADFPFSRQELLHHQSCIS